MHLPDPDSLFVNPQGEWNSSRIVFDNGHVEHWLNGHKILEFEAWTDDWFARKHSGKWETAPEYGLARRGVICLQDHGSPASFRNLKIKELPRKAGREVELFNGKDLTGWEAYGTEKWYVDKDGNMVCESGPDKEYGYLATREYYNDFDLTLEFKQLANGNSGVFFRSFVEPPVKVHGWQCEVAPKGFDTAGIYESYGRGWLVQIPDEKEDILREGEWNTLRLKVQGDRVQTWLNGEEMVDITGADLIPDRRELIEVRKLLMRTEVRNAVPQILYQDWVAAIADRTGLGPDDMYPRLVVAVVRAIGDTAMEAYANADPPVSITKLMRAGFDAVIAGLPEPTRTKE